MNILRRALVVGAVGTGASAAVGLSRSASTATPDPQLDAGVSELVGTSGTQTQSALDQRYVRVTHRPVNLADRLAPDHTADTDATSVLQIALTESSHVEWPHATTLRLTSTVAVPTGSTLQGRAGALARIDHSGTGFEVSGTLRGVDVSRVAASSNITAIGAWAPPGSTGATIEDLEITGDHAAGVAVGGSPEIRGGTAIDATVRSVRVGRSAAASSYNFRLDDSLAVTLQDCVGLGAALDNIKARIHCRDFRVVGGRYTGSANGDGIDAYAGGEGGYIGGGVLFEDQTRNGIVVKTDFPAAPGIDVAQQASQYGLPRQVVIDGVIVRRVGGSGIALHRTDANDQDYAAGVRLPWLADVTLSNAIVEESTGSGLFINGFNFLVDNVQVIRPFAYGVEVHTNARQHRFARVAVRAAGYGNPSSTIDAFRLNGKHLWFSQCVAYGVVGDFADETDYTAATKYSRYGFISAPGTGATHHFTQCTSFGHRTASLAGETPTSAPHSDGDYEGYSSGFSLGGLWLRNNGGALEKSANGLTSFSAV